MGGGILSLNLSNVKIALIYGDKRDKYLAKKLIELNAQVSLIGFEKNAPGLDFKKSENVNFIDDLKKVVVNSDVLILPMAGVENDGTIKSQFNKKFAFSEEIAKTIKEQCLIIVGVITSYLKEIKKKYNLNLIEVVNNNEFAILNSIPSAEGAIQKAMELTDITIHNSYSLVMGFGRTAMTLARMLQALGANTFVTARNHEQLARAYEMNCKTIELRKIDDYLAKMDIIFNTIPSMVLPMEKLKLVNKDVIIIDLASAPGGLDYNAASKLGIAAYLLPGLPGKVAPVTAGRILGEVYPKIIIDNISKGRGGVINVG